MVFSWLNVAIIAALALGAVFAAAPMAGSLLLAPKAKGGELNTPYECGIRPHGTPWMRFGINYFFYALLFLAFDVDVLYLFPAAAAWPQAEGIAPLVKITIFLGALAAGCLYFVKKGVFEWPRRIR